MAQVKRLNRLLRFAYPAIYAGGDVPYEEPSYANLGGTGDRTGIIAITTTLAILGNLNVLVNGVIPAGTGADSDHYWNPQDAAGKYVRFHFASPVIINEVRYYRATDGAFSNGITNCVCQWKGSNGDIGLENIGATFTPTTAIPQIWTTLSGNTTPYTDYWLWINSGTLGYYEAPVEIEFKIGNALP